MDNLMSPKLIERRSYLNGHGRFSLFRDGIIVFEREGCPYRLTVLAEEIVFECEDGRGALIRKDTCPSSFPRDIWDEAFKEVETLLLPGTATGPWNLDDEGARLQISHHRCPYPNYPLRSYILSLAITKKYEKEKKDPYWTLSFSYSNDVTQDKWLKFELVGKKGTLEERLTKEVGGYFASSQECLTWSVGVSPALHV